MNPVKGNGFLIPKKAQNSPEGGVMRTLERAGVIQGGSAGTSLTHSSTPSFDGACLITDDTLGTSFQ